MSVELAGDPLSPDVRRILDIIATDRSVPLPPEECALDQCVNCLVRGCVTRGKVR